MNDSNVLGLCARKWYSYCNAVSIQDWQKETMIRELLHQVKPGDCSYHATGDTIMVLAKDTHGNVSITHAKVRETAYIQANEV